MNDWLADHNTLVVVIGWTWIGLIALGGIACTFDWF